MTPVPEASGSLFDGPAGPGVAPIVLVLGASTAPPGHYEPLRARLHSASLRTVLAAAGPRRTVQRVRTALDGLGAHTFVVVGDRDGADLAWSLAASGTGRFTALISVDRGHPRIADVTGAVRDADCGAIVADVTALVTTAASRAVVAASRQWVHGDLRIVTAAGRLGAPETVAQLATEVVLRTSGW